MSMHEFYITAMLFAGETDMPNPFIRAFINSSTGLRSAWKDDASFRRTVWQVLACIVLATALSAWLNLSTGEWLTLVASQLPIVVVELINTAIEAVTDKASPERHPLAKKAKDIGSAAVLMTRLMALLIWIVVLLDVLNLTP
jgi:diacylglycerol kinase (ATP)